MRHAGIRVKLFLLILSATILLGGGAYGYITRFTREQAEAMAHLGHWEIDVATWTSSGSAEYWKIYDGFEGGPLKRSANEDLTRIHPEDRPAIDSFIHCCCSCC